MSQILQGTPLYKITISIFPDEDPYDDVISLTFFRCPIVKTASFGILYINLRSEIYLTIQEMVQANDYPIVKLSINMIQDDETNTVIQKCCDKTYTAIYCKFIDNVRQDIGYIRACIYLVNPVLYYMQTTSGFNRILPSMTAYSALSNFENWLTDTFGQCFHFLKVGDNYEVNPHVYDQIQITQPCDLLVPTNILMNYKPFNTFSYYFFDCFNLSQYTQNDITATLINLGDYQKFTPVNITGVTQDNVDLDIFARLNRTNLFVFNNPFNELFQEWPSIVIKSTNRRMAFKKGAHLKKVPTLSTQSQDQTYGGRTVKYIQSNLSSVQKDTTEQTIIYAPDDPAQAYSRFKKVSNQARDAVSNIQTFYLADCHYDIIQFMCRYNFDIHNINSYSYVPISICNMFVRNAGMYPSLTHTCKFQVIKYAE